MKKVLIIEDCAELAAHWQAAFESHELHVIHEPEYEKAIELLGETAVDLVITDIALPDGKGRLLDFAGLAILSYIALKLETPPKVIAVSGANFEQSNLHFLHLLECAKLLQKPFDVDTIVDLGMTLIAEKSLEERLERMKAIESKHATDSVLWLNVRGEFVYASEAAVNSYQYSQDEFMNMIVTEINPGLESIEQFTGKIWPIVKQRGRETFPAIHQRKDGSTFPVEVAAYFVEFEGEETVCSFVRDITRRLADEEGLRLLGAAVDASQDAFVIAKVDSTDAQDKQKLSVVFTNDAYKIITGYTLEETLGKPPRLLDGAETNQVALGSIADAFERRQPLHTEILLYEKSGSTFWCDFQLTPIEDGQGKNTHWLMVFKDVTTEKMASQGLIEIRNSHQLALAKERAMLRRSNSDLEQFAYVASHDLQEPLRAIGGFMQMLDQQYSDQLDDTAAGYVRKAVAGAARMEQLIKDLLHFSKITREANSLQPIDLNDVVASACLSLEDVIKRRGAEIDVGTLPMIQGERTQLTRMFQNLIDNAIKYCEADIPRVSIQSSEKDGQWQVFVSDNGIGVDPEYRNQIFAIFKRLHRREQYPGTGIGLAICHRVVQQHGGSISIEDNPDLTDSQTGCRFVLKFPKLESD